MRAILGFSVQLEILQRMSAPNFHAYAHFLTSPVFLAIHPKYILVFDFSRHVFLSSSNSILVCIHSRMQFDRDLISAVFLVNLCSRGKLEL